MADAFREALAEQSSDDGPSTDSTSEPSTTDASQPPVSSEDAPEQDASTATDDSQRLRDPEISRISSLLDQGRESELTSAEMGTLNRIRATTRTQIESENAQEDAARHQYIEVSKARVEDPEAYDAMLHGEHGATWLAFKRGFEGKHPEVSLEHPNFGDDTSSSVDTGRITQDAKAAVFRDQNTVLEKVAEGYGVTKEQVAQIESDTGGGHAMIPNIVKAAVEAGLEKERPKLAESERTAALKMVTAENLKSVQTPRTQVTGAAKASGATEAPKSLGDTFLEVKEQMEKDGSL